MNIQWRLKNIIFEEEFSFQLFVAASLACKVKFKSHAIDYNFNRFDSR